MEENDKRNSRGRFTSEHTDGDVLAAVRAHEPAATSEVADELGVTRQSADYRLRRLRDAGRVNSKKIGASLVWFPADDVDDAPANTAAGEGQQRPESALHSERGPDVVDAGEGDEDAETDVLDVVETVAEEWDDSPDRLDARKAAARAVLAHAVESGEHVGKSDAVERFFDEYPVEGQKTETWWRKNIRNDILSELGEYSQGNGGYRVTADDLAAFVEEEEETDAAGDD